MTRILIRVSNFSFQFAEGKNGFENTVITVMPKTFIRLKDYNSDEILLFVSCANYPAEKKETRKKRVRSYIPPALWFQHGSVALYHAYGGT